MTIERLTIVLDEQEAEALRNAAQAHLRKPRDQARYLLRQALLVPGSSIQEKHNRTGDVLADAGAESLQKWDNAAVWQQLGESIRDSDAPDTEWALNWLTQLHDIWPTDRPVVVLFVKPSHEVWRTFGGNHEAACNIQAERIVLYFRDDIQDSEESRDLICHEYAHAVLAPLVDPMQEQPETIEAYRGNAYVQAVEAAAHRLGGLLEYAARTATIRPPTQENSA